MQSFKSFSGQYHVWLIHHNGQSHWDSHSDFGKAKADAVFAAHEHNCKAIVMHDNFKHVATALPDGKMRTHLHEAYKKKSARSKDPTAWVNDNYKRDTEDVPISWIKTFPGNGMRKSPEEMAALTADVKKNGIKEPLIINVGSKSRTGKLGEGNHRLEAAIRAGYTHVPARVMVGREYGSELKQYGSERKDIIPKADRYYPADAKPSAVFSSLKRKNRATYPQDN